ncbi:hypothetical protein KP509_21G044300 [Ceratopteris richardii]|nr:hypothetical protein KP509_21G044300 [Ceratopteris richardii]
MQSSYERLAAHRIAQHYGLQSMVVTASFPKVSRILLVKTPNSKLPSIRLADIPVEGAVSEKSVSLTNERIAIMQRERTTNVEGLNGSAESGRTPPKTMEEREVEYDKARARIFSSDAASAVNGDDIVSDELDMQKMLESSLSSRIQTSQGGEGKNQHVSSNRVAIFRDREKDMKDPDYDRSYKRYVQPLEPSTSAIFATLYRMYSPVNNMYDKYNRFNGPWSPQGQVDQPTYMPAVHFRGPRVDSSYPDISYVHYGQGHSDAYWQCQRFPAHMAQYAQLKDGSPQSFQHGLQLPTSLGTLGR